MLGSEWKLKRYRGIFSCYKTLFYILLHHALWKLRECSVVIQQHAAEQFLPKLCCSQKKLDSIQIVDRMSFEWNSFDFKFQWHAKTEASLLNLPFQPPLWSTAYIKSNIKSSFKFDLQTLRRQHCCLSGWAPVFTTLRRRCCHPGRQSYSKAVIYKCLSELRFSGCCCKRTGVTIELQCLIGKMVIYVFNLSCYLKVNNYPC